MKNNQQPNNSFNAADFICRIEQENTYDDATIKFYEDKFKTDFLEELADYATLISSNEEEASDIETSYLMYYNSNNFVDYYLNRDN